MDKLTLDAYTSRAHHFAAQWHAQPAPVDMYDILKRFFVPGGQTADIGCGSGRDVAWLNANGFPVVGYDASDGLLAQARANFPALDFRYATLPELNEIGNGVFDNVLCETVIMHLPRAQIARACARLFDMLKPAGVLYLSWRGLKDGGQHNGRDESGRLYSPVSSDLIEKSFHSADILLDTEALNQSSGNRVHRIVARRHQECGTKRRQGNAE